MKINSFLFSIVVLFSSLLVSIDSIAQDTLSVDDEYVLKKIWVITKNDNSVYVGEILKRDAREILIKTKDLGEVYIPMHEIRSIEEFNGDISDNKYKPNKDLFSSNYFLLNTNAFNSEKGNHHTFITLLGPEIQYSPTDNLTIGGVITWFGTPLIANVKYSIELADDLNLSVGTIAGSAVWANPNAGGILPSSTLTLGDRSNNISVSGGAIHTFDEDASFTAPTISIAGSLRLSAKSKFIFDSFFIFPGNNNNVVALFPSIRVGGDKGAFQFGIAQFVVDDTYIPFPIIGWFRPF